MAIVLYMKSKSLACYSYELLQGDDVQLKFCLLKSETGTCMSDRKCVQSVEAVSSNTKLRIETLPPAVSFV